MEAPLRPLLLAFLCGGGFLLSDAEVVPLHEANWTLALEGEWMLEFMAPWCPACTSLKKTWTSLGSKSTELGINVAEIDVTVAPGLSGRFLVTALPTIYHVINAEFRQYKGSRDEESLFSYIEAKRWKNTEPLPWWKDPNTIQMSYVSHFFKMSQMLRVVHNTLLETYGLPTWGSYLVFALGTILLGSFIGLIMVACIDFFYPQKAPERPPPAVSVKAPEVTAVMNDDLVDEEAEHSDEFDSQESDKDEEKDSASDTPSDSENDDDEDDAEEDEENSANDNESPPTPKNGVRKRNNKPNTD